MGRWLGERLSGRETLISMAADEGLKPSGIAVNPKRAIKSLRSWIQKNLALDNCCNSKVWIAFSVTCGILWPCAFVAWEAFYTPADDNLLGLRGWYLTLDVFVVCGVLSLSASLISTKGGLRLAPFVAGVLAVTSTYIMAFAPLSLLGLPCIVAQAVGLTDGSVDLWWMIFVYVPHPACAIVYIAHTLRVRRIAERSWSRSNPSIRFMTSLGIATPIALAILVVQWVEHVESSCTSQIVRGDRVSALKAAARLRSYRHWIDTYPLHDAWMSEQIEGGRYFRSDDDPSLSPWEREQLRPEHMANTERAEVIAEAYQMVTGQHPADASHYDQEDDEN